MSNKKLKNILRKFLQSIISKDIHTLIYFLSGIAINLRRRDLKASILIAKYGLLRSFYLTSNLSEVKRDGDINYISRNLQTKGISFLPDLEDIDIKEILSQYEKKCQLVYGKSHKEIINELLKTSAVRGGKCFLEPSIALSNVIFQKDLIEAICKSFRLSRESISLRVKCDTLVAPMNQEKFEQDFFTSSNIHDNSLRFHRDLDGNRFLKMFIYLTDCYESNGSHCYVEESARKAKFGLFLDKRLTVNQIKKYFGVDSINTIIGKAGTSFIEDTTGWHSGKIPREGVRIMLQILFIDKESSKLHPSDNLLPSYLPISQFK